MAVRRTSTPQAPGTPTTTVPEPPGPPPTSRDERGQGPGEPWSSVLAGVREAVVVTDRAGVVRAANEAAHALLPRLTPGEIVDTASCPGLGRVLRESAVGATFEVDLDGPSGPRRLQGWSREVTDPVGDGGAPAVGWYLLDVTAERHRADTLLAAQDRAQFLATAGRALHGVLHLDRTVRSVAQLAAGRLAPSVLVLVHAGDGEVRWARADGPGTRAASGRIPLPSATTSPHVHAALTVDGPPNPWAAVELSGLDVWAEGSDPSRRRLVTAPVPANGTAHALLVLVLDPAAPEVDAGRADLLAEYASRAGAAVAAAALFGEQSRLGDVLQASLAPPPLPEVPGAVLGAAYRPARESLRIAGDFYEVHTRPAQSASEWPAAFLLGDVCGKGVDAAVLSGRVRQSLQALRLVENRPAALLDLLNTALLDTAATHGEPSRFATMVVGDARPGPDGTLELRMAAGGHPPPLVLRADGTVETVDLAGTLVGGVRGARFVETDLVLAPGDLCLIYSDGLIEARGDAGYYGEDRLEVALASCAGAPAPVVCERVMQLLVEFLGGREHDDVALLALQAPPAP